MVILDAPPLLPVTDAGLLTVTCDGALLVVAVGKTARRAGRAVPQGARTRSAAGCSAPCSTWPRSRGLGAVVYGYGGGKLEQGYGEPTSPAEAQWTDDASRGRDRRRGLAEARSRRWRVSADAVTSLRGWSCSSSSTPAGCGCTRDRLSEPAGGRRRRAVCPSRGTERPGVRHGPLRGPVFLSGRPDGCRAAADPTGSAGEPTRSPQSRPPCWVAPPGGAPGDGRR